MALITCPKCEKQFSEHAKACPQCGIPTEEALLLIQKQEVEKRIAHAREVAERERQHQEFLAEQERIRTEKRAEWWAANKKKVWISVSIVVAIIIAIFVVIIISDVKKSERQRIETAIRERNLHSEQWKNDRISKIKQLTVNKLFKCTQPYSNQLLYELYVDKDENNRWITTGRTLALMIEIDKDFTTSVTVLLRKGNDQDLVEILRKYKNLGTDVFAKIPFKYSYSITEEQIAEDVKSYMEILLRVREYYSNQILKERQAYTEQVRIQREAEERDRAISKADGYVDLGLPSGTLWKTENEDCGLVTYDKAYELYGNSLPTYEQLKELNDKCQWIWKGNGYKIIGKNGETIFMPAAGYRPCDGPMKLVGSYGYCWASTPVGSEKAWRLGFCSNNVFLNPLYRCCSFSVRLVR